MPPVRTQTAKEPRHFFEIQQVFERKLSDRPQTKYGTELLQIRYQLDPAYVRNFSKCNGRPGKRHNLSVDMGIRNPHNFGRLRKGPVSFVTLVAKHNLKLTLLNSVQALQRSI